MVIGEQFEDYVFNQIKTRQRIQHDGLLGNTNNTNLTYNNNRNAWVKLASSVEIKPNEGEFRINNIDSNFDKINLNDFAKQFILFNGISFQNKNSQLKQRSGVINDNSILNEFNYGFGGTEQGINPPPGITDVQIKTLNRGSIRKATVQIMAYNQKQFELIEMLYLRLGYHMMLEWGWDKYFNINNKLVNVEETIIDDYWFNKNSFWEIQELIRSFKARYEGNYNGFIGRVNNFSWNFESDGTYKITIDLISLGSVVESLKINISSVNNKTIFKNTEDKLNENKLISSKGNSVIHKWLNNVISKNLYDKDNTKDIIYLTNQNNSYLQNLLNTKFFLQNKEDLENFYYISFKRLTEYININIIPLINGENSMITIDYRDPIYIKHFYQQISFFPNKMIINPYIFKEEDPLGGGDYSNVFNEKIKSIFNVFRKFYIDEPKNINDEKFSSGNLNNIYFSFKFIVDILDNNLNENGELSVFKFYQNLCNEINSCLGGVNKIEPIMEDDRILTFIDQSFPIKEEEDTQKIVPLEIYGINKEKKEGNFVKNISFDTKITKDLISQISIGATANNLKIKDSNVTGYNKFHFGLQDRYSITIETPIEEIDKIRKEELDNLIKLEKYYNDNRELNTYFNKWNIDGGLLGKYFRNEYIIKYKNTTLKANSFLAFYTEAKKIDKSIEAENIKIKLNEYLLYLVDTLGGKTKEKYRINGDKKVSYGSDSFENAKYFKNNIEWGSMGKNIYNSFIKKRTTKDFEENKNINNDMGFLPLSLNITLDGMSGMKIYNQLQINQNFLPNQYNKSLKFLIKGISESITNNNWEVKLDTLSTSNLEQNKKTIKPSNTKPKPSISNNQNFEEGSPVSLTTGIDVTNNNVKHNLIYYPKQSIKWQLYLHHTAGQQNAEGDINEWKKKNFPLATHYHINRNGFVENIFDEKYFANHLNVGNLEENSLSIEIVSLGWFNKKGNGTYEQVTKNNGVITLPEEEITQPVYFNFTTGKYETRTYKGYRYYQKYTPQQIEQLRYLLLKLKQNHPAINWSYNYDDLFPRGNDLSNKALKGIPGVFSHGSVRRGKSDVFPQKELLIMLQEVLD